MDLRDAKVLLTGATGGIGQALAVALAARGGEMMLTGRRTDMLEPLAEKLGGRAIPADLADRDTIEDLLEAVGEIDVLVANAALSATGLLADYSS
jgi:short-subunit dehydrogenase